MDGTDMLKRLKLLRSERGLSQEALGKAVSMSQQSVWKWENGLAEPDLATLSKLADFFGVSTDYLLSRTDCRAASQPSVPAPNPETPAAVTVDGVSLENFVRRVVRDMLEHDGQHPTAK